MPGDERAGAGGLARLGRFLRDRYEPLIFILGLLTLAFAYGVAVGKGHVFPQATINQALDAARDWQANWRARLGIRSEYLVATRHAAGGVTRHDPAAAYPGHTLLAQFEGGRFGVTLVDMDGRPVHRWRTSFAELFPGQNHLAAPPDEEESVHGFALLPGGDLLVNLSGYGAGRIDRCSRPVWTVPAETHHAVDALPGGDTLIPSRHRRSEASPRHPRLRPGPNGFYFEDTVLRVRPDGSVAEERSVLDLIYASDWAALFFSGPGPDGITSTEDPTHLNDVEALRPEMAAAFPMFRAGDVMLSLRNINTILVVDGQTWRVKWAMSGPFLMQHDPDFLPNGHILVFDNRATGAAPALGHSRIIEIDPLSREIVRSYQGSPEEPFYTRERGESQGLPNGNVLAAETFAGRAFEVARDGSGANRIVWEYVNLQQPGFAGIITGALRVADPAMLSFVGGACP